MKIEIDEKTGIVTLTFNGYKDDKEGKQVQTDDLPMLNKLISKYKQMIEAESKQQLRLLDRYLVNDDAGCVRFIYTECNEVANYIRFWEERLFKIRRTSFCIR